MIGRVLAFLREHLDAHLKSQLGDPNDPDSMEDKVTFVDGDKLDPLTFRLGAVTELLLNVEEERQLRAPDRYARRMPTHSPGGREIRVQPDIRLALHVLFVARFRHYDVAWDHLSAIIQRLLTLRVFERGEHPDLPEGIEKLILELMPVDLNRQSELWSAMRVAYHPSILYEVRWLTFRDQHGLTPPQVAQDGVHRNLRQRTSSS